MPSEDSYKSALGLWPVKRVEKKVFDKPKNVLITYENGDSIHFYDQTKVEWYGSVHLKDGSVERKKGWLEKANEQWAKDQAEKQKQEAAAHLKKKQALYPKYGKQYVDKLLDDDEIIVGIPIELVKQFCVLKVYEDSGTSQIYRQYGKVYNANHNGITDASGPLYTWIRTLFVRNGRITDIVNYY